jgi:hypothetical protein
LTDVMICTRHGERPAYVAVPDGDPHQAGDRGRVFQHPRHVRRLLGAGDQPQVHHPGFGGIGHPLTLRS